MDKKEIALQLTLARLEKLHHTTTTSRDNMAENVKWNEEIASETVKMFNTIYKELDVEES